jgi:hypothetical protein
MEGIVASYDNQTLALNVDTVAGTGTYVSWNIGVAGQPGATGPAGPQGPQGIPGATPIDSPVFTGNPRGPTPTPGDNDTSLATTAYVTEAISHYQLADADLTSLAAATGTNNIYYRSAANTWSSVTIGTNITFSGGTLSAAGATATQSIATALVAAGGSGYAVGNAINLTAGVVLTVSSISGTAVSAVTITNAGSILGTATPPANPVPQITTNGSGTGATFNLTWSVTAGFITGVSAPFVVPSGVLGITLNASHFVVDATPALAFAPAAVIPGTPTLAAAPPAADNSLRLPSTGWVQSLITPLGGKEPAFASGTSLLLAQSAAPTGYTKGTIHNDKALRVVSGVTGGGGAGSVAFSTVFGRTTTDLHTLSVAEMPSHAHPGSWTNANLITGAITAQNGPDFGIFNAGATVNIAPQGGDTGHNHPIDLRVQYVDVIIAAKN